MIGIAGLTDIFGLTERIPFISRGHIVDRKCRPGCTTRYCGGREARGCRSATVMHDVGDVPRAEWNLGRDLDPGIHVTYIGVANSRGKARTQLTLQKELIYIRILLFETRIVHSVRKLYGRAVAPPENGLECLTIWVQVDCARDISAAAGQSH